MRRFIYGALTGAVLSMPAALSAEEIQQFIINGQSLSAGDQSWPALSTTNFEGNYMLGDEVWINGGYGNMHNYYAGANWNLKPLYACPTHAAGSIDNIKKTRSNGATSECAIVGAVNHMQLSFLKGKKLLATSVGVSGATVEQLSKERDLGDEPAFVNHHYYTHFLTSLDEAKKTTEAEGLTINCPAIFWMQGEFNYMIKKDGNKPWLHFGLNPDEDNCTDTKTYKERMLKLKENMQNDIMAKYGQTNKPVFITYQTGGQYVRGKVAIGMAQLQAANENDDVIMAGSPYPCTDRGGHLDPNGYRWFGEMLAKAYYRSQVLGQKVIPLQPKKITRSADGKTVRINYYVPFKPLVFDTNTLPKIKNYGFNVYNNSQKQTIKEIKIEGDDVVMTFDTPLTGKLVVTYGDPEAKVENQPKNCAGLQGHGNLRDSDPYESKLTYIDLDEKDANGKFIYARDHMKEGDNGDFLSKAQEGDTFTEFDTLRPNYEPKDESGNVIYGKPYPLYNFGMAFYYTLPKKTNELVILDEDNKPMPIAGNEPGTLDEAYVDETNGSDTNAGSAEAPFKTLNKAVAAIKWAGAKVIVKGTVNVDDELDLEDYTDLTIIGEGEDACLQGNGDTRLADAEKVNVTLSNLKCTGFKAGGKGGVMSIAGGNLTVSNCVFEDNGTTRMKDEHGGVFYLNNCGEIKISDSEFINNQGWRGGAIYAENSTQLTVENSLFDSNKTIKNPAESDNNSRGGAMSVCGTNTDIDNCIFRGNESSNQCGVFQIVPSSNMDQHFTVKNCDIIDNKAPKDHGGVMVAENSSQKNFQYNFINCTISGNSGSGVGTVFWILSNPSIAPTQTLNIYNCTITGNHNTNGTFNSTVTLWDSDLKTNIVNTILEGNTCGGNKEYSDLHAGEFYVGKGQNIQIKRSVVGKFMTLRNDKNKDINSSDPNYTPLDTPKIDEISKFNISPAKESDGVANYAELLPRNDKNAHVFKSLDSKGIGMGDDSLLASAFGLTTDRFGNVRKLGCIGSVEFIDGYTTGLQLVTAEDSRLALRLDGDCLKVSSQIYGNGTTLEVFAVDGRLITTMPMTESEISLSASQLGNGIRVLRVSSKSAAKTALFRL